MQDNAGELWKRLAECESAAGELQALWSSIATILDEQEGKLQAAESGAQRLVEEERAARQAAEERLEALRAESAENSGDGNDADARRLQERVAALEAERDELERRLKRAVAALRSASEEQGRRAGEMERLRDRLAELSGTSQYADAEEAGAAEDEAPEDGEREPPRSAAAYAEDLDATKALLSRLTGALDEDSDEEGGDEGGDEQDDEPDTTSWGAS